jgi:hypothetical protein
MHQRPDDEAHQLTEEFIERYSRRSIDTAAGDEPAGAETTAAQA